MAVAATPEMVLEALGLYLAGLNLVRYSTDADYGADDPNLPAYVFQDLPPSPDTAVAATVYSFATDRDDYNPDVLLRLRFRAAGDSPATVALLANAVRGELKWPDYRPPQTWPGGVRVLDVRPGVLTSPVKDSNGRWMRVDPYRLTLNPGV